MRNMWVVIKETYLRHVKSLEFLLYGDFAVPLLALSVGIGFLKGLLWPRIAR